MKRIKFPLVMKNGAEVRDIEELRKNFDLESIAEYFSSGKLEKWLENNYYDDMLEEIQELDSGAEDFGRKLSEALGVEWKPEEAVDLQKVMKNVSLKEQIKPFISDKEVESMEHIADTQEELEAFAKAGDTPIYLFGERFIIRKWMRNVECIGVNEPTIELEIMDRTEYRDKKIKLREVAFADENMKKVALDDSPAGVYYKLLETLGTYLDTAQKVLK